MMKDVLFVWYSETLTFSRLVFILTFPNPSAIVKTHYKQRSQFLDHCQTSQTLSAIYFNPSCQYQLHNNPERPHRGMLSFEIKHWEWALCHQLKKANVQQEILWLLYNIIVHSRQQSCTGKEVLDDVDTWLSSIIPNISLVYTQANMQGSTKIKILTNPNF